MERDPEQNFQSQFRGLGGPLIEQFAGQRVDAYLARQFPFLTRAGWQKRMDQREVLVNQREVRPSYRMRSGDQVHFFHPAEAEPHVDNNVRVLWQQGAVLVAYKPGNLPMHENGAYRKNTFARFLHDVAGSEWSAVHRLDRETSGIVLCGATHAVRQSLAEAFEARGIAKEYLMLVNGIPTQSQWTVDGPIGDLVESQIRIKKWVVPGGLSAETGFVVEATCVKEERALLRAYPKTGRTNQIRIHAAWSGHWIIGDKLYHPNEDVFLDYWDSGTTTPFAVEQTGFHRCCLHAAALTFLHPEIRAEVRVESPLPEDMQELWIRGSNHHL